MLKSIIIKDPIVGQVVDKFISRSEVGLEKYKETLSEDHPGDLGYWATHLEEELMDGINYIQALKLNMERLQKCKEEFDILHEIMDIDTSGWNDEDYRMHYNIIRNFVERTKL